MDFFVWLELWRYFLKKIEYFLWFGRILGRRAARRRNQRPELLPCYGWFEASASVQPDFEPIFLHKIIIDKILFIQLFGYSTLVTEDLKPPVCPTRLQYFFAQNNHRLNPIHPIIQIHHIVTADLNPLVVQADFLFTFFSQILLKHSLTNMIHHSF